MAGKKQFYIDLDECTGCDLCVIACKDEYVGNPRKPWTLAQPDTGHFWMDVNSLERGTAPKVKVTHMPLLCQHCDNAPCMKVCPEDAIARREDGLVWIDSEKCTGCGLCQEACPYDVIYMNESENVAQKCTGCAHIVEMGKMPRCADVCPRDAIYFADEDDPKMIELRKGSEFLHPEYETQPNVFYKGLPKPFLAGIVVDARSGEVVSGVKIEAVDLFNDKVVVRMTDGFGDFWLAGLVKGHRYRISMKKEGYRSITRVIAADTDRNIGDIHMDPIA